MISVMALLYICPMEMSGNGKLAMTAVHNSCENSLDAAGAFTLSRYNPIGNCINIRLALVGQTLKNLTGTLSSFYLMVVLSVLVFHFFTKIARKFLAGSLETLLNCARHFHRRYRTLIKLLVEKKLRRYLTLLGNYTVALVG